jgi:chromosome segregation ATPase
MYINSVQTLEAQNKEMSAKAAQLELVMKEQESSIETLNVDIEKALLNMQEKEKAIEDLKSSLDATKLENQELIYSLSDATQSIAFARESESRLKESLTTDIERIQENLHKLQQKYDNIAKEKLLIEEKLQSSLDREHSLEGAVEVLETRIKTSDHQLNLFGIEIGSLQQELVMMKSQCAEVSHRNLMLTQTENEHNERLAAMLQESKQANETIEELMASNERLRDQLNDLQLEIEVSQTFDRRLNKTF